MIFCLAALYEELKDDRLEYKASKEMISHLRQAILSRLQFFCARYFYHGHRSLQRSQKTPNDDEISQRGFGTWVFRVTEQFPVLPDYVRDPILPEFSSVIPSSCFFSQVHQKTLPRVLPRDEVQQNLVPGDHAKCSRSLARMMSRTTLKIYGYTCESLANEITHPNVDIMVGEHRIEARTNYRALTNVAFDCSLRPDTENAERLCLLAYIFDLVQYLCLRYLGDNADPPGDPISQERIRSYASVFRELLLHIFLTKSLQVLTAFLKFKRQQIPENHEESYEALLVWLANRQNEEFQELLDNSCVQVLAAYKLIYQILPTDTTPGTIEWDITCVWSLELKFSTMLTMEPPIIIHNLDVDSFGSFQKFVHKLWLSEHRLLEASTGSVCLVHTTPRTNDSVLPEY